MLVMLFKSNLNEIIILIAGMVYAISEVLIFFTRDMQTEFSFTVEGYL
jgi:predicted membrane-bound mannosyltransferase